MKFTFLLFILLAVLGSCKTSQKTVPTADSSLTSIDWPGTYTGTLPCHDCEGIQQVLKLNKDLTFQLSTQYKGKSAAPIVTTGKFTWNKQGNKITLSNLDKKSAAAMYLVGENRLFQLDNNGNRITGDLASRYELDKVNTDIVNKYWKLVELNGREIQMTASDQREPHIILRIDGNRVSGTGSCNSFSGSYQLQAGNRVSFSQNMATTLLPCVDNEVEPMLIKVLQQADNYSMSGDTLMTLNKAKMAPLAKFRVVYFK
jgi:heat shock protein HslJ